MMNVKKYRAATTRGALEMIKHDLGEDAFVLETKKVKTGGFLGIRSTMQIEVSAAAAAEMEEKPKAKAMAAGRFGYHQNLNLTDDTPAGPSGNSQSNAFTKKSLISALSARTNTERSSGHVQTAESNVPAIPDFLARKQHAIESVEISSLAPRIVHPKKDSPKPSPDPSAPVIDVSENASAPSSSRDLELLRAELREVKFSLGAFANQRNAQSWQTDVDLDLFGEIFELPFYDVYVELIGTGISDEIARNFVSEIIPKYKDGQTGDEPLTQATLVNAILSRIKFSPDALQHERPVVMAVIGATGVGKTTTVAKLAARVALYQHRRVELVTLDTYRIAAVEQLKTYAEIIGAGCHVVRSVFELDAVLRRLPADASVLIDTTGRSPHDLADQYELSEYLQQRPEIRKCLTIQATTHPIDAAAAIKKFAMYGADCLAVTKMDETMRAGAVIETIAESGLPLAYFCTGQRVPEDLQVATAASLTNRILGNKS